MALVDSRREIDNVAAATCALDKSCTHVKPAVLHSHSNAHQSKDFNMHN